MPAPGTTGLFFGLETLANELAVGFEEAPESPFMKWTQTVPMKDGQGSVIRVPYYGNEGDWEEEWDTPDDTDEFGGWYLDLSPVAFFKQYSIHQDDLDDDKTRQFLARLNGFGINAKMHQAKRLVSQVIEGSFTGFDGVAAFSASHTWVPTNQYSHRSTYTTNQSNLVTGQTMTSAEGLRDGLGEVMARQASLLNEKGIEMDPGLTEYHVIAPKKQTGGFARLVRQAFANDLIGVLGQDTNRDMNTMVKTVEFDPYLSASSVFYVIAKVPGRPMPFGILERKAPTVKSWMDDEAIKGGAQRVRARQRYEVFPYDWTQVFKVTA